MAAMAMREIPAVAVPAVVAASAPAFCPSSPSSEPVPLASSPSVVLLPPMGEVTSGVTVAAGGRGVASSVGGSSVGDNSGMTLSDSGVTNGVGEGFKPSRMSRTGAAVAVAVERTAHITSSSSIRKGRVVGGVKLRAMVDGCIGFWSVQARKFGETRGKWVGTVKRGVEMRRMGT